MVETLLSVLPERAIPSLYRTSAGAEMDLVIDHHHGQHWAIEFKRSLTPKLTRDFQQARADLQPHRCFVVTPIPENHPLGDGIIATIVYSLVQELNHSSC